MPSGQWDAERGALTFDTLLPLTEDEDIPIAAPDNKAELIHWHYHLGHLTFPKLKQLAINGKIPKKLAKLTPPKCTQATLAWQRVQIFSQSLCRNQARGDCLS